MSNIAVVYWSGTGNTENMATEIESSAKAAGAAVSRFGAMEFSRAKVAEFDVLAFGCPAMGAEQLEDGEFEPMFSDCLKELKGKKIALFGSYGWGDGEWMRSWEDSCKRAGAQLVSESVICCGEPDSEAIAKCAELGKTLAEI